MNVEEQVGADGAVFQRELQGDKLEKCGWSVKWKSIPLALWERRKD